MTDLVIIAVEFMDLAGGHACAMGDSHVSEKAYRSNHQTAKGGVSDTEIMKEKGVHDFNNAKAYSFTAFQR